MEKNLHILLCEDEESLGMLVREYLEAKGYNAELFLDGEWLAPEVWERIKSEKH